MCIDFRKNQRCPKLVYIKGEAVERVDTYKYLGVVFDSKLNWKENINSAHCVCVLVCTLGMSLCRCSFVCVRQSIFNVCVTCCDLDVTLRRH